MPATVIEKFYADNDMVTVPPVPCEIEIGSTVHFLNDYGLWFGPFKVLGYSREVCGGRFVHINSSSPWFPVRPDSLHVSN